MTTEDTTIVPAAEQTQQAQAQAQPKVQQPEAKGNAPVETLWDGRLKLSIFRNQSQSGVDFSTTYGRVYSDAQGKVKEAKTLNGAENLRMAKLLEKGYDRINHFKEEMKSQPHTPEHDRG